MNQSDIDDMASDNSSGAVFTLKIHTENGRITEAQRLMVGQIIQRVCTGLTVSLEYAVPGRYEIELERQSSSRGVQSIDIG